MGYQMSNKEEELGKALTDVRKAFRLLWVYQRRLLDIIHVITDQFDHKFYCWDAMGGRPPGRMTTDPTDEWAWSMLPFYQLCLLYLPPNVTVGQIKKGEWLLEISIQSDDGYPVGEEENEPDPTLFPNAEASGSFLYLRAWYCKQPLKLNWYSQVWRETEWPAVEFADVPKLAVAIVEKSLSLAALGDKEAVEASIADFKGLLHKHLGLSFAKSTAKPSQGLPRKSQI
jgi:hypothetical protein